VANLSLLFTHIDFLPGLLFDPENGNYVSLRNIKLSFKGVMSQKTELFIMTAVGTLHLADFFKFVAEKKTFRGMIWMG
jgi:hypothetical protein